MKKQSLICLIFSFFSLSLPLQAIIISDESIKLQKIWETQPSLQQKLKLSIVGLGSVVSLGLQDLVLHQKGCSLSYFFHLANLLESSSIVHQI